MDRAELKETFHRVSAYRHVCRAVRNSAGHTMFSALIYSGIAFMIFRAIGPDNLIFLFLAGFAIVEWIIFVWKRLRPSAECVLVDAINSFAFAMSILVRAGLAWHVGRRPDIINLGIGIWVLYGAWQQLQAYLSLRRAFELRPTRQQMDYVRSLVLDIRDSDPATDQTALDLDTQPPMKMMLADEVAFVVVTTGGDALVFDRDEVSILRNPDATYLMLQSQPFAVANLDSGNWRNYCRWKGHPE